VESLPPEISASEEAKKSSKPQEPDGGDLKIAWRYQHLPTGNAESNKPVQFGHHFDLSRTLSPEALSALKITNWVGGDHKENNSPEGSSLFYKLKKLIFIHL